MQLNQSLFEHVARAVERSRMHPRANRRSCLYEREARLDRAYESWGFDVLDDAVPALHGRPFVSVL